MTENAGGAEAPTSAGNMGNDSQDARNKFAYRGNFRRNNRGGRRNNYANIRSHGSNRFEGSEPSLKGHIYDFTGERNPDQYIKTTKQIKHFVGRTYTKFPAEFTQAIDDLRLDEPVAPVQPRDPQDVFAMEVWKIDLKDYRVKETEYTAFKAGLYNVVMSQCTEAMQDKIKSHPSFAKANQNGIELLKIIKVILYSFEQARNQEDELMTIKEAFYTLKQGNHMTLQRYYELFTGHAAVMREVGINITDDATVMSIANEHRRQQATKEDVEEARERALAIRFIRGANANHNGEYLSHLRNSFLEGTDLYPRTLTEAYHTMSRREPVRGMTASLDGGEGVSFVNRGQASDPDKTQENTGRKNVKCFNCGTEGHYANQCNKPAKSEGENQGQEQGTVNCVTTTSAETTAPTSNTDSIGFSFSQPRNEVPKSWILLDNQSTVDMFCNPNLLTNIRESGSSMRICCNAGCRITNMVGELNGYGTVWFDPKGIANILSFKKVRERYHVAYDAKHHVFTVTKPSGKVFMFRESDSGLYYMDTESENGTLLVNTVAGNRSNYTNEDYLRAVKARELQIKIGRPSLREYIKIIESNYLPNCPVTKRDVMAAEHIFGPDIGSLKGKTTRRNPHAVRQTVEPLPPEIMSRYRHVTLCIDIMYVNGIPFLVTLSRNIRFGTVEALSSRRQALILAGIRAVTRIYRRAGFEITQALMDGEFECLRGELAELGMTLNSTARDEHVGDVERYIRTIKERMRAIYNTLPFNQMPPRLVIEMAKQVVFWLNSFPHANGIPGHRSPRAIITGVGVDYAKHCRYQFGEYVQTHEEHDNSMTPRTIGALALRPTGNSQGSFQFFSLSTGRVITRNRATSLPMPDDVINQVHRIARRQKAQQGLMFGDRSSLQIDEEQDDDDEDDDDYVQDESLNDNVSLNDNELSDSHGEFIAGVEDNESDGFEEYESEDEDAESSGEVGQAPTEDEQDAERSDEVGQAPTHDDVSQTMHEDQVSDDGSEVGFPGVSEGNELDKIPGVDTQQNEDEQDDYRGQQDRGQNVNNRQFVGTRLEHEHEQSMNEKYGARSGRYNLRNRKPRDYSHLFLANGGNEAEMKEECEVLETPQMNMKQGIKLFGEAGVEAIKSEMQQLHDRKVMKAKKPSELSDAQKKEALAYLMFLKRKRCGKIKGRGCADGRKQRAYVAKEDAASPTVASESVFLTAVIDALEEREVAIFDVPGAFMQADMDELVHVRFTGKMVDLLVRIDRDMYEPCVTFERGEKVMYVELLKALYGTLRAARLFWEKLSSKLHEWGFVTNPYDSCVVNKMVEGTQMTVAWHVDDLKVSHKRLEVIKQFAKQLNDEFGKETPISESFGKIHDYLGMKLDYSVPGEVIISMSDYIKVVLQDAPDDMQGVAATPASNRLFKINDTSPTVLSGDRKDSFVHLVMQLLYLSQRARPDIRTAVSFLCARLHKADEDDYKKLGRVIKYLRGTIDLPLRLRADGTGTVKWWVDASYAVHPDMKGHTGGTMSLGSGSIYSTSTKQKLVARSSTESEVIGVHDVLPQVIWTSHFLREQGMNIRETVLFQDNMSSMLLEKNGRSSSSKRTRHMDIRFFFIKDRVDSKDVRIEYCPTGEMLADFFTKPLQGKQFYHLRDMVLNVDSNSVYHSNHRSVLNAEEDSHDKETDVTEDIQD